MQLAALRWGPRPLTPTPPQPLYFSRCWCLNFRGRVKQASVKNFQLVRGGDPAERVVLQFGKVERDTYICDFNPTGRIKWNESVNKWMDGWMDGWMDVTSNPIPPTLPTHPAATCSGDGLPGLLHRAVHL